MRYPRWLETNSQRREAALVAVSSLLFGAIFCAPVLSHLGQPPAFSDWDEHLTLHWVPYETVVRYHQFPLWNPWMCGGLPMLADPQSRFLSPFFLLHLMFGPIVGLQLEIWLHLAIAAAGGYSLGRVFGLRPLANCAVGSVFTSSSFFVDHLVVGHMTFSGAAYLPWLLCCGWVSFRDRRYGPAVLGAIVLALMMLEAATYATPHALVLLFVIACTVALQQQDLFPLRSLACTIAFAIGFAAPKIFPVIELMRRYQRHVESPEANPMSMLISALFSRDQDPFRNTPPGFWRWHEYGAYVGAIAAGLALVGIAWAARRSWVWATAGLLMFVLAAGDFSVLAPWHLIHLLPLFSSQRVPSRFLIEVVMCLAVLAGVGADVLMARVSRGRVVVAGLICLAAVDAWLVSVPYYENDFDAPAGSYSSLSSFTQSRDGPGMSGNMYPRALANRGTVNCYDPLKRGSGAVAIEDVDYRGEFELLGRGTARLVAFSPNELSYQVAPEAPSTLVINANPDSGWSIAEGRGRIISNVAKLEAEVPAGLQTIVLRYRSTAFQLGVLTALVSAVAAIALRRYFAAAISTRSNSRPMSR